MTDAPRRVLVVDDEEIVRNYVRRALESDGFLVAEAEDGASAVREAAGFRPGLVICDLKMPDMDGRQVIGEIRSALPGTRFVLITGSVSDPSSFPGKDAGVDGFLIKPFGIDEVRALAGSLLPEGQVT